MIGQALLLRTGTSTIRLADIINSTLVSIIATVVGLYFVHTSTSLGVAGVHGTRIVIITILLHTTTFTSHTGISNSTGITVIARSAIVTAHGTASSIGKAVANHTRVFGFGASNRHTSTHTLVTVIIASTKVTIIAVLRVVGPFAFTIDATVVGTNVAIVTGITLSHAFTATIKSTEIIKSTRIHIVARSIRTIMRNGSTSAVHASGVQTRIGILLALDHTLRNTLAIDTVVIQGARITIITSISGWSVLLHTLA